MTMKLEQQVCSLDLARRLKELGVKQEHQFQWLKIADGGIPQSGNFLSLWVDNTRYFISESFYETNFYKIHQEIDIVEEYSAFTVAELGEILPAQSCSAKKLASQGGDQWGCVWPPTKYVSYADTEADARAKMLVYLLENGLLKI